jgi:hypothetical protein
MVVHPTKQRTWLKERNCRCGERYALHRIHGSLRFRTGSCQFQASGELTSLLEKQLRSPYGTHICPAVTLPWRHVSFLPGLPPLFLPRGKAELASVLCWSKAPWAGSWSRSSQFKEIGYGQQ